MQNPDVGLSFACCQSQRQPQPKPTMTTTNAIKKLTKAGFEVSQNRNAFTAQNPQKSHLISFYKNGGADEVVCINVRRPNDMHDSQSDYHAGFFANSITQAIALA